MRLQCPTCGARYRLDPALAEALRARPRPVRCRCCSGSWISVASQDVVAPPAEPAPPRGRRLPVAAGVALVLLALGVGGAVAATDGRELPAAQALAGHARPVAAALGGMADAAGAAVAGALARLPLPEGPLLALPAPPASPLELRPLSVARAGGVVDVAAVIRNPTPIAQPVPAIEILLVRADGRPVARQEVRLGAARLDPGERREVAIAARDEGAAVTGVALRLRPGGLGRS